MGVLRIRPYYLGSILGPLLFGNSQKSLANTGEDILRKSRKQSSCMLGETVGEGLYTWGLMGR